MRESVLTAAIAAAIFLQAGALNADMKLVERATSFCMTGKHIVVGRTNAVNGTGYVWVYDIRGALRYRLHGFSAGFGAGVAGDGRFIYVLETGASPRIYRYEAENGRLDRFLPVSLPGPAGVSYDSRNDRLIFTAAGNAGVFIVKFGDENAVYRDLAMGGGISLILEAVEGYWAFHGLEGGTVFDSGFNRLEGRSCPSLKVGLLFVRAGIVYQLKNDGTLLQMESECGGGEGEGDESRVTDSRSDTPDVSVYVPDGIPDFANFRISPYSDGTTRGMCVTKDYIVVARIRIDHGRGCLEIFSRSGKYLRRIVGPSDFFGHGAASDNKSVWTTDYFGRTVYQFDIVTGALVRTWPFHDGYPVRIEYDRDGPSLIFTAYNHSKVFVCNLDGEKEREIEIVNGGENPNVAEFDNGYYVLYSPANDSSDRTLYKYDRNWKLVSQNKVDWGYWCFDFLDGVFYYDTAKGDFGSRGE